MRNARDRKDNMYSHLMKQGTELILHTDAKDKETHKTENTERWKSMTLFLERCACALTVSR